jgi:diguanylate cyclase (GGDEF)-like protein
MADEISSSWSLIPRAELGAAPGRPQDETSTAEVRLTSARSTLRRRLWFQLGLLASATMALPAVYLLHQADSGWGRALLILGLGLFGAWAIAYPIADRLAKRLADADELERAFHESERLRAELESEVESREVQIRERTEELQTANRNLERLAREDGLTGIANHRRFVEFADQCWRLAAREGRAMALFMVDVDHFKAYNDIYGHQAGDQCLRRIARELNGIARRPLDLAARYGGEEFAVILTGISLDDALDLAEIARRAVERLAIPHSGSVDWQVVTISLGVARIVPQADAEFSLLINLADAALYRAKRNGRNRFER